ncbi:hypothetical protein A3E39_03155 [Candidatus Uhrbacteria bacterium RIFCSPHIGHO2_12_FULL_60_25]|uniref:Uncharacterized protein n=1 Tax=Candidatus Uhrbacteria bacterium RIFCSPHIGHO2_12_FULL_60_25 TaxID=1802399 RepID=A0A1F7UL61_9BACT|nr:MAG: hypothetical protein A3D73_01285 [Candidatus Uhrbacteria bacterium RIFCSPHIGHO2_02_FULL_60_44]OGL78448.1 MAG: hypothetical protein A3E39_03155 [Candidatus Uhrbacteria bacterium RIFCSPHIGHO2_12_FULL_60_25]
MDHFVVDSTPKGSAILAYGRARGPRWNGKLLALIAGSFAVIGILVYALMSTKLTLPLPIDRLLMVAIRPKQAVSRLNTELRQSLPPTWRTAIETRSSFPAILGVALDADNRPRAFALILRTTVIVPTETVQVTDAGAYRLLTNGTPMNTEDVPLSRVWSLSRRLRRHDLSFTVNGALLSRYAELETKEDDDVTGVWDGTQGTINVASTNDGDGDAYDAPIFSRLGDHRDDALPAVAALTSQGIDVRMMTARPTLVSVRPDAAGGVVLTWPEALAADDLLALRAALGVTDRRVLALPDETGVIELFPSSATATVPMSTSTWWLSETILRTSSWNPEITQSDPACPGQTRFLIQDQALQNLLTAWNVPIIWQKTLQRVRLLDTGDSVRVCVN